MASISRMTTSAVCGRDADWNWVIAIVRRTSSFGTSPRRLMRSAISSASFMPLLLGRPKFRPVSSSRAVMPRA